MGREIKRVPMNFHFPLGESAHDAAYAAHDLTCTRAEDECRELCEIPWEPPVGEGWQLWQTVSDGPISPVFATADELIDWMCQPVPEKDRTRFQPSPYPDMPWAQGWKREVAEPFVKDIGWAPSGIVTNGKWKDGVTALVEERMTVEAYVCGPSNTKCSCQCPEGPCEHEFTNGRDVVGDTGQVVGNTLVCERCGMDAIAHSLWTGP